MKNVIVLALAMLSLVSCKKVVYNLVGSPTIEGQGIGPKAEISKLRLTYNPKKDSYLVNLNLGDYDVENLNITEKNIIQIEEGYALAEFKGIFNVSFTLFGFGKNGNALNFRIVCALPQNPKEKLQNKEVAQILAVREFATETGVNVDSISNGCYLKSKYMGRLLSNTFYSAKGTFKLN
ncbi:hypothetical protein N9N67_02545 [Bacteriovoracaceae bacterium]|nr:hypothetical protein [Bacteriovoracaceae bacterium]